MKTITVCDVLRAHGARYIQKHKLQGEQKGIIKLLSNCKTGALGDHFRQCDHCDHRDKAHNSCRNRHCPNCQQKDREKWIGKRMEELLPTGYYHLVFTIPHQLNALCLQNKRQLYAILFKAASETVLELGKDQKHMGAETGLITVLHTWGQNMMEHPHLHCIMPAGGLTEDKSNWVHPAKGQDFFVHYKVLSAKFRGKFLDLLQQAYNKSALSFHARLLPLAGKRKFNAFMSDLYKKQWVVNIQKPIAHPKKILEYLSRYVFRIAISDRRIIKIENGIVHFIIKDYKKGGIFREMKLELNEFIRRFLLHILPKGFMKIRYYGIFANRGRAANIAIARQLLAEQQANREQEDLDDGFTVWQKQDSVWDSIWEEIQKHSKFNCPACKQGRMLFAGIVHDARVALE
jgi:hypothetical protein